MSVLRPGPFSWNPDKVARVAVSGIAVFVAVRVTDRLLIGLGVAVALAMTLDIPRWLYNRYTRSEE
ncbi:hypothetical protein DJ68_00415 [Halorubrum sp. C3]|nr:hypothetical protein DJ68_00415 [Halorubrum sp. C3]